MFVRVELKQDPVDVKLVPDEAIQRDLSGAYLLTLDEKNIVQRTPVELGQVFDGLRACMSGLDGDARVIVNGIQRARVGGEVAPRASDTAGTTQNTSAQTEQAG